MVEVSDGELVRAAQAGERDALEQLLRRHQDRIHALARRLMADPTDALDAAQEAMIAVVRGLPSFDGRSAFTTWLYRVCTNACLDELRRRKRRPVGLLPEYEPVEHSSVTDLGPSVDLAEQATNRIVIDAALAQLAEDFRAPVVLRDLCQLDYAEIAEVLAIPPGTVRSRIARGRAQLAATLGYESEARNQNSPDERPTSRP